MKKRTLNGSRPRHQYDGNDYNFSRFPLVDTSGQIETHSIRMQVVFDYTEIRGLKAKALFVLSSVL